jgi:hypothetical protein
LRTINEYSTKKIVDVKVGKNAIGRLALKKWFDTTLRDQFTGTAHHIGNHIIDFNDSHNAHGVVYSKNEHETENEYIYQMARPKCR